jgi:hypothetical protein
LAGRTISKRKIAGLIIEIVSEDLPNLHPRTGSREICAPVPAEKSDGRCEIGDRFRPLGISGRSQK